MISLISYIKQVRRIIEFGVLVWHSGLPQEDVVDFANFQKSFLHIALKHEYDNYTSALCITSLKTLVQRRLKLCSIFAWKASKHHKHCKRLSLDIKQDKPKHKLPICRLGRTNSLFNKPTQQ